MINQLAELVKIYHLTPKGLRSLFLNPKLKEEKVNHLLKLVMDNPEVSDDVAKQAIYGDKANSNAGNYNMLKVHLREKLLKYVCHLSPNLAYASPFLMTYFKTHQQLFLSKALLSIGLLKSGISMAKSAIKKATEIESWDVIASLASTLSDVYIMYRTDDKKSEYYHELAISSMKKFQVERKSRRLLNLWNGQNLKNGRPDVDGLAKLREDVRRITEWNEDQPTAKGRHFMHRLSIRYELLCLNFKEALNICDNAIRELETKPYFEYHAKTIYTSLKMFCYLYLKDLEGAKRFAEQGEHIEEGTNNWFTTMEFYFLLFVQKKEYYDAHNLVKTVTEHLAYQQLIQTRKQRWVILQAYMELLIITEIWKDGPKILKRNTFKVERFINQVDVFKGDKTGFEVSILVVYILFKITYGQFEDVIDKRDALSRFIRRYLNQKEHARSRVFLTMLKKTIDLGFSYQRVKKGTDKLFVSLKSKQMNYSHDFGGNEIVDYEVLWEWLLTRLKDEQNLLERYGSSYP